MRGDLRALAELYVVDTQIAMRGMASLDAMRLAQGVLSLLSEKEKSEAALGEMREALRRIQYRAAPGHRTMDEMADDLMWIDDETRRTLRTLTEVDGQEEKR